MKTVYGKNGESLDEKLSRPETKEHVSKKENDSILMPDDRLSPEQQAGLWYERCNKYLMRLNFDKLSQCLNFWGVNENLPMFMAKKSMLLHLMGEKKQSTTLIEQALQIIRLQQKQSEVELNLISQESYILILWRAINIANLSWLEMGRYQRPEDIHEVVDKRLNQHKIYKVESMERD